MCIPTWLDTNNKIGEHANTALATFAQVIALIKIAMPLTLTPPCGHPHLVFNETHSLLFLYSISVARWHPAECMKTTLPDQETTDLVQVQHPVSTSRVYRRLGTSLSVQLPLYLENFCGSSIELETPFYHPGKSISSDIQHRAPHCTAIIAFVARYHKKCLLQQPGITRKASVVDSQWVKHGIRWVQW